MLIMELQGSTGPATSEQVFGCYGADRDRQSEAPSFPPRGSSDWFSLPTPRAQCMNYEV
eukprot:COSAG05_NODE_20111_length_283_cov_0.538043_1_plen_58_part_01